MTKKKNYLLRTLYEQFLIKKINEKAVYDYATKPFNSKYENIPNKVATFLSNDEPLYAYSILDNLCNVEKGNMKSWLKKYFSFIRVVSRTDVKKAINADVILSAKDLDISRKDCESKGLYKFDGMQSLIDLIGEENFIKHTIENSFFFSETMAQCRDTKIKNYIRNSNYCVYEDEFTKQNKIKQRSYYDLGLPSRKTSKTTQSQNTGKHKDENKQLFYEDENGNRICKVIHDSNGNAKVCAIINKYTGYNLNATIDHKPFKNYIISHVWGRAIDPRYFTNFWNIVLIPAWANHLMDKDDLQGTLSSKLKATIMAICRLLYEDITPEIPTDEKGNSLSKDIQKRTIYKINVIYEKDKANYGKMKEYNIDLKNNKKNPI